MFLSPIELPNEVHLLELKDCDLIQCSPKLLSEQIVNFDTANNKFQVSAVGVLVRFIFIFFK